MILPGSKPQKGADYLQQAVEADKSNKEIRLHLAQAFIKLGQKAKAIQELDKIAVYGDQSEAAATARKLLNSIQ